MQIWATALPFGMASLWLEQAALGTYPGTIKDQRAAAILALYAAMFVSYLAYAAIAVVARGNRSAVDGTAGSRRPSLMRRLGSVAIIATIAPLGTIAGLAAAVVPGIVLWVSWVLAAPLAGTTGEAPFAALRRSARMTWGSRRALFYLFAGVQLATFAASAAIAVVLGQPVWAALEDSKPPSGLESLFGGLVASLQLAASGAICSAGYARLSPQAPDPGSA